MSDQDLLTIVDDNQIRVRGLLSVDTVAAYQEAGYRALAGMDNRVVFDMQDSEVVGSAAIALLISWQRKAVQQNVEFAIINAPQHLLEMADISGVLDILHFSTESPITF